MQIVINQVTVTNWSKDPLYKLDEAGKTKLGKAITYSRQIVGDSLTLLKTYSRRLIVASVDTKMATDYFDASDKTMVDEAMSKYFGLNMTASTVGTDLDPIITKFQLIKTGIDGPFDLVVGGIHDADDVKQGIRGAFGSIRGGSVKDAISHLKFIRTGTEGWVHGGHAQKRIHLNKEAVKTYSAGKIARIIVHEASHKFASTIDVAYKWDELKNNAGAHVGLNNNADSYAWAGRLMWKRKRNLPTGV